MAVSRASNGRLFALYINTDAATSANVPPLSGSSSWRMLACLSSNGVSVSIEGVETTSRLTAGWYSALPGNGSWVMNGEAQAVALTADELINRQSVNELFKLCKNKTVFWAAIFDVADSTYRVGVAYISNLSESMPNAGLYTGSVSLQGVSEIFDAPKGGDLIGGYLVSSNGDVLTNSNGDFIALI